MMELSPREKMAIGALVGLRFWRWVLAAFVLSLIFKSPENMMIGGAYLVFVVGVLVFAFRRQLARDRAQRKAQIESELDAQERRSMAVDRAMHDSYRVLYDARAAELFRMSRRRPPPGVGAASPLPPEKASSRDEPQT